MTEEKSIVEKALVRYSLFLFAVIDFQCEFSALKESHNQYIYCVSIARTIVSVGFHCHNNNNIDEYI